MGGDCVRSLERVSSDELVSVSFGSVSLILEVLIKGVGEGIGRDSIRVVGESSRIVREARIPPEVIEGIGISIEVLETP